MSLAELVDHVIGVDPDRDRITAAVVCARTQGEIASKSFATTARGYGQAMRWAKDHTTDGRRAWSIESTGSYGAGLASALATRGEFVIEFDHPATRPSKDGAKSDSLVDPFHVVALAGDKLNATRQRIQRELTGGRGRADDPLYKARRTLRTGRALLTDKQKARLSALWAIDEAVPLEVTWLTYQDIIDAYRHPDADVGKKLLTSVIDRIKTAVPAGLEELAQLGRTLEKRRDDILAWFDHPGSSNGPTEAINGRLEHLRGIALGFRNLVNYLAYVEFRISDGMSTSGLC